MHGSRLRLPALAACLVTLLAGGNALAHGGHGHHYRHGHHGGYHHRARFGFHVGHGHYRHHGHRYGGVSFAWSGPLYLGHRHYHAPAVAYPAVAYPAVVEHATRTRRSLPDMPDLEYVPGSGQDAARLTLDRRACERQAWRATRPDPTAGTVRVQHEVRYVQRRGYPPSPLPDAAGGALLGAIGGAIAGDAGAGAAIGAAVGAASWLIGSASAPTVSVPQEVVHREYVPPPGPDADALRASLVACMEDRGYGVR